MHDSVISLGSQTGLQTPDVPVCQSQTPGRFDLPQMTFLDLLQHFPPLPFSGAHADPLLFHRASQPLEKGTFLLCTNRTFSFCGDIRAAFIDASGSGSLRYALGESSPSDDWPDHFALSHRRKAGWRRYGCSLQSRRQVTGRQMRFCCHIGNSRDTCTMVWFLKSKKDPSQDWLHAMRGDPAWRTKRNPR
jgi:hypothetical protein